MKSRRKPIPKRKRKAELTREKNVQVKLQDLALQQKNFSRQLLAMERWIRAAPERLPEKMKDLYM